MPKAAGCRHTLQRNSWLLLTMNSKLLGTAGSCWVQSLESAASSTKLLLRTVFQVSSRSSVQSKKSFRYILCDSMPVGSVRRRYELLPWDAPALHISAGNSGPLYVFFYGSEHIEDKPLCTSTKTCRNEPEPFGTHLVSAVNVKLGGCFSLFFSDNKCWTQPPSVGNERSLQKCSE